MLMILFLLLVPLAEIATFVAVGSRLGAGLTVLLVVVSAVVSIWLVRRKGFATATRVQAMIARGESPALGMLEGMALLVAGVLLVLPGFLTDIAAFMLLIPPLRRGLLRLYLRHMGVTDTVIRNPPAGDDPERRPLEGESRRVD